MIQRQIEKGICQVNRQALSSWLHLVELKGQRLWKREELKLEKNAGNRKQRGMGLLAMLSILDLIPTKWKTFEVVGFGCILET